MASNAKETAKQENGSLFVFQSFIEKGKIPTAAAVEKAAYNDMPSKWYTAFDLQAKALKKYIGTSKGYNYSRDKAGSMMPFLEDIASKTMGVSTKDRWNPMDVVMTKKNKEVEIKKKVKSISVENIDKDARLVKLNNYMASLLKNKTLLPISLKEVKKGVTTANIEEANLSKGSKGVVFSYKKNTLKCNISIDEKTGLLDTGELAFDFYAEKTEIHVQSRSFRYSIPSTGVQTDLTPKGRQSGAKLGKASTSAIDPFLSKLGLSRPKSPSQHPEISLDGNFTPKQIKYWNSLHKKLKAIKIENEKIDLTGSFSDIFKIVDKKKKKPNVLGRLTSKLVVLEWLWIYAEISKKKKFKEWMSVLYYGAKKEFSELNGPFIKIY
jgi:hypothetical protein